MEVLMFLDDIHYIDHTVLVGGMILNIKHIPRGTFAYWNIMDVDSIKIEEK